MVYESDFYTVRRPYSRPTITSYSVTAPRISVTTWRVKPSIRTSVLIGELDRIHHRSRPHLAYVPTEDFLNSRPLVDFDDETKMIRAETERLMKRIYTSVPHPRSTTPLQIVPYYGQRANEKYNSHRHYNSVSDDIFNISHYNEPSARTIGRGHLACVTFAGGRGYPRRKHLYLDENRDIQDEIKFRSYYNKNRAYEDAMSLPTGFASYLLRLRPDNRNGTLTSSQKLHITQILQERKSKNSVDDNNKTAAAATDGTPEKKTSTYESKTGNETVIPIERETKPFKYKSKDTELCENRVSEINSTVNSSGIHTQEEPQQKLSEQKPELTSIVQPEEKITEINVEPKVQKENIKLSRKTSKTKIKQEEKEEKIQPKSLDHEEQKQVPDNEVIIESEKMQEEKPSILIPNLSEVTGFVKQETDINNLTEGVINEPNNEVDTETIIDDCIIGTEPTTVTESSLATESSVTTQSPTAAEKEIIDVDFKVSNSTNIEENLPKDNQNERTEKNDILELDLNKTACENDEKILEIVDNNKDDNVLTIENVVSPDTEQTIIETVFQSRQVIVSSTVEENSEVVVTSQKMLQESAIGQTMDGINEKNTVEETPQVNQQTDVVSNQQESGDSIDTKEIRSEDFLNRLNTEASADYSTPQEKIIEIEIERPDDLENIIEEVTDLRFHDAQKGSDTEPLVEEPQSPESELIYNKTTTNEICEVLSDVAEEA